MSKHTLNPNEARILRILMSDVANNMNPADPESEKEAIMLLGRYTLMKEGAIPYEGPTNFTPVPTQEVATEKTYTCFFFAPVIRLREAKMCLRVSLSLVHDPHGMKTVDPNIVRFSVSEVTREAASRIYSNNETLFTGYSVKDTDREVSGRKEKKTRKRSQKENEELAAAEKSIAEYTRNIEVVEEVAEAHEVVEDVEVQGVVDEEVVEEVVEEVAKQEVLEEEFTVEITNSEEVDLLA